MWKDFFYFTRAERQGILILAVLCILVFVAGWLIPVKENTAKNDTEKFKKEYAEFMSSIREKEQKIYSQNKGGKFRRAEDFRKVYGLTQEQYEMLLPYIYIATLAKPKDTLRLYTRKIEEDTLNFFKYAAGTVVELNSADTTELKKIPGIGSGIARMITGYRNRLGGFYDIAQLKEIHLDVEKLRPWFNVVTGNTRRLNINRTGIERLKAHPYINFYQAKIIVEYRKKKGILKSLKQLSLYEEFTPQDLERISHYICFE